MQERKNLVVPLVTGQEESSIETQCNDEDRVVEGERPFRASYIGAIVYTWVRRGVVQRGRQLTVGQKLGLRDMYALLPCCDPQTLATDLMAAWQKDVANNNASASLLRAVWHVHTRRLLLFWFGCIVKSLTVFVDPLFINQIINYASDDHAQISHGLFLAFGFFLFRLIHICIGNNMWLAEEVLGVMMQNGLVAMVFRKTLVLRNDAFLAMTSGKLTNLITTDAGKVRSVMDLGDGLIGAPLQLTVAMVSLHHFFGSALYIGLAYWLLFLPLTKPIMDTLERNNERVQKKTDARVQLVEETVAAVQIVKCNAWEDAVKERIHLARQQEMQAIFRLSRFEAAIMALVDSMIPVITLIIFAAYTLLYPDAPLTAAKAFTAVNLLEILRNAFFPLPMLIVNMIGLRVSMRRIQDLFQLPEVSMPSGSCGGADAVEGVPTATEQSASPNAVTFLGASFRWPLQVTDENGQVESSAEQCVTRQFELKDLSLKVPRGKLVAVVGATASGKSSLLQAVLGEMPQIQPASSSAVSIDISRPVGFVPQQPWIFNGTVRENILFGEPFDSSKYTESIRCCDLDKDLALLHAGDLTRVGEKGIALSGGQKARLALARAVYRRHECELFLLDDPYSALDVHVAQQVHKQVVCGVLGQRTRLVATNRLEFIHGCDLLVVLDQGRVCATGRYEELRRSCNVLCSLLDEEGPTSYKASEGEGFGESGTTSGHPAEVDEAGQGNISNNAAEQVEEDLEEARQSGLLSRQVLMFYFHNMGGLLPVCCILLMHLISESIDYFGMWWLSKWTSQPGVEPGFYLSVYSGLGFANIILQAVVWTFTCFLGLRAARCIHNAMLDSLLRAPLSFFQDTPQGRIMNRFSNDTSEADRSVVQHLSYFMAMLFSTAGAFCMVGVTASLALIPFVPLIPLYVHLQKLFSKAITDIKRLSKTTASPVYDLFGNVCRENGLSVIRAFQKGQSMTKLSNSFMSDQVRCELTENYVEKWYYQQVQSLGAALILAVGLYVVLGSGTWVHPSTAAMALTVTLQLNERLPDFIRALSDITVQFNSIERMHEYVVDLPTETLPLIGSQCPSPEWPRTGALEVQNLRLRYKPQLPIVLKGIGFNLGAGERMGVVGRTGAGKSSLIVALFRTVEPEQGSVIKLDGENLLTMNLRHLRNHITLVPQSAVLFQGTLQYNCDPFGSHGEEAIWAALEQAQLAPWLRQQGAVTQNPDQPRQQSRSQLEFEIKEGGQNLSMGQRQMVALARAVLRKSNLVVLDEATAAVDTATDTAIQKAIRTCFVQASTLTIAHRLETILDSDRIMVLEAGNIAEFGSPADLIAFGGIFKAMVDEHQRKIA